MKHNSKNVTIKTCPKCRTKNQKSSRFCKKCGSSFSGSTLKDKKATVLAAKKRRSLKGTISIVVIVMFLVLIGSWLFKKDSAVNTEMTSLPEVSNRVSYSGQAIGMTDIEAVLEDGRISIPLDAVLTNKIVRFNYENKGLSLPLLAYITPSGKAVTAVSVCEPCRSTRFHIKGKTMVCNSCATEWKLETLQGIKGGCLNYPPDYIPSIVENGRIWIDERAVSQWRPRV